MKLTRIKNLLPIKSKQNSVSTPDPSDRTSNPTTTTSAPSSTKQRSAHWRQQAAVRSGGGGADVIPLPRHPSSPQQQHHHRQYSTQRAQQQQSHSDGSHMTPHLRGGDSLGGMSPEEKRLLFTQKLKNLSESLLSDATNSAGGPSGSASHATPQNLHSSTLTTAGASMISGGGVTHHTGAHTAAAMSRSSGKQPAATTSFNKKDPSTPSTRSSSSSSSPEAATPSSPHKRPINNRSSSKNNKNLGHSSSMPQRLLDFTNALSGGGGMSAASIAKSRKHSTTFANVVDPTILGVSSSTTSVPLQYPDIFLDYDDGTNNEYPDDEIMRNSCERQDEDQERGRKKNTKGKNSRDGEDESATQEKTIAYVMNDDAFTTLKTYPPSPSRAGTGTGTSTHNNATSNAWADAVRALLNVTTASSMEGSFSRYTTEDSRALETATYDDTLAASLQSRGGAETVTLDATFDQTMDRTFDQTATMDHTMDYTCQSLEDSRWCETYYTTTGAGNGGDDANTLGQTTIEADSRWCAGDNTTLVTSGYSTVGGDQASAWWGAGQCNPSNTEDATPVDGEYAYSGNFPQGPTICTWGDHHPLTKATDCSTVANHTNCNATQATESSQSTTRLWYKFLFSCAPPPGCSHKMHVDENDDKTLRSRRGLSEDEEDKPPLNPCMAPTGRGRSTANCVAPLDSRLASFISQSEDSEDGDRRSHRSPVAQTRSEEQDVRETSSASSRSSSSSAVSESSRSPSPYRRNKSDIGRNNKSKGKNNKKQQKQRNEHPGMLRAYFGKKAPPRQCMNTTSFYTTGPPNQMYGGVPAPVLQSYYEEGALPPIYGAGAPTPPMHVPMHHVPMHPHMPVVHHQAISPLVPTSSYPRRGRKCGVQEIAFMHQDHSKNQVNDNKAAGSPSRGEGNWIASLKKKAATGFRRKPLAAVAVPVREAARDPYFDDYYDDDDNSTLSTKFSLAMAQRQQQPLPY